MLGSLRARGYQLLVISPDPVSFERQGLADSPAAALATRLALLERALVLRSCAQSGVPIVDWQVDRPFQQVAEAALSRAPLWLRSLGIAP
jgi:hypothetical protein